MCSDGLPRDLLRRRSDPIRGVLILRRDPYTRSRCCGIRADFSAGREKMSEVYADG